jgi:hypothetical protein
LSSVDIIASDKIYLYIILLLIFFKRKKLQNKILAVNQNPKELTNLKIKKIKTMRVLIEQKTIYFYIFMV